MNRRSIILVLGLVIAGYLAFFADKPPSEVSEPVVRSKTGNRNAGNTGNAGNAGSTVNAGNTASSSAKVVTSKTFNRDNESVAGNKKNAPATQVLSLLPREALIVKEPPKPGKGLNPNKVGAIAGLMPNDNITHEALFDSQTWDPPPPPPPKPGPPPPPVAPPIPYVVIGKKLEDQAWEVYLTRGEQTFIAREKLVLENQYRIDSIKPPTMTLTYLPLNQTQTLTIGGTD